MADVPMIIEAHVWMAKAVEMVAVIQETHIGLAEVVAELSEEIVQTEVFRLTAPSEIEREMPVRATVNGFFYGLQTRERREALLVYER